LPGKATQAVIIGTSVGVLFLILLTVILAVKMREKRRLRNVRHYDPVVDLDPGSKQGQGRGRGLSGGVGDYLDDDCELDDGDVKNLLRDSC
jgi:hypothetical protein